MNAVPIFEAKNRLPFFIHKAETEGPVAISRRNKEDAFIISKEDYEAMSVSKPKSVVETIRERHKKYGLDDDDFDYTEYFDSLRERDCFGRAGDEHIFDEV